MQLSFSELMKLLVAVVDLPAGDPVRVDQVPLDEPRSSMTRPGLRAVMARARG